MIQKLRMYLTKRTMPVFVLACSLCIGFILFGLFVPIRLTITKLPSPLYADIHLDNKNTTVKTVSLFGVHLPAFDVYGKQNVNGEIIIWSKDLSYKTKKSFVVPKDTTVSYDGDGVYVGQSVDKTKIHVSAIYDDNLTRDVTWFNISDDKIPLSSDVSIPVQTAYGTTKLAVKTIAPKEIKAEYASCKMGDVFNRKNVTVTLVYPDDTTYQVDDFLIPDAPKYIANTNDITVCTDYGNTTLHITPDNAADISVSYDDTVYVGDEIRVSKIHLHVGDTDLSGNNLRIDDGIGIIKSHTQILVNSKYGNAVLDINPVGVKDIKPEIEGELLEGEKPNIKSITLTFDDDTSRTLSSSDYQLTNLSKGLPAGAMKVWFKYQQMYFSFDISAIPQSVINLRKTGKDIPTDAKTYDLTDEQINQISILCQRLASDDLNEVAAEASLLANRYELYGSSSDTSGDALLNYMISSKYWGADSSDYMKDRDVNTTASYVVHDVLMQGHRALPLYVDERQFVSDRSSYKDGDMVTKTDGTTYRYYGYLSDNTSVLYGYTEIAYQKITGKTFDTADTSVSSDNDIVIGQ